MLTDLTITTRAVDPSLIIELAGVLDFTTAPDLHDCLRGVLLAPGHQVIIDLGLVTFCDSSGISALLAARNHVTAGRSGIALCAVPGHLLRVLQVVGLDRVFSIHPSPDTALAAWATANGVCG